MKAHFIFLLFCIYLLLPVQGQAQLIAVSGFVRSQSTGEIKRSATIFESVSGIGTITNREGYYRLLLNPGKHKLEISSAGYYAYTSTFNLVADTIISVELIPLAMPQEKDVTAKDFKFIPYAVSDSGRAIVNRTK